MNGEIVVDTSIFIDFFRSKSGYTFLDQLVLDDRVILSEIVRLELLARVRRVERFRLMKALAPLRRRAGFPAVKTCETLLKRARDSGLYGGIADVMVLADAFEERAFLATKDMKLARLAEHLGVKLLEVG